MFRIATDLGIAGNREVRPDDDPTRTVGLYTQPSDRLCRNAVVHKTVRVPTLSLAICALSGTSANAFLAIAASDGPGPVLSPLTSKEGADGYSPDPCTRA